MEKEKESDSDNKPTTDLEETHHPSKSDTDETTKDPPLYFTKDGKAQFGITPPTAFALSYPFPPLPSNLAKNRVLRASDEARKESVQEGIDEAEKEFEKEAMPLPSLKLLGSSLPKVLIPEIELALYWDRHPYEFRVPEKGQSTKENGDYIPNNARMRRSKSDMNLASKVGKLLEEQSIAEKSNSRRSSVSASNKTIRSSIVTSASSSVKNASNELLSPKSSHYEDHLAFAANGNGLNDISNGNQCSNGKCGSANSNRKNNANGRNPNDGKQLRSESWKRQGSAGKNNNANANQSLQMSESERKKFEDIGLFRHQSERQSQGQNGHLRKPIRSQDQLENNAKKSTGVQVTIDDVAAAALKSTYLCPLHGQYRRGIERRDKGGFRTDMSSRNNVHLHCSRALKGKPSKTKMIKTIETQTEDVGSFPFQIAENRTNKRSRTAGHGRGSHKGRDIMASEYHGSFKDPYKIAESEKRHLPKPV